MSPGQTKAKLHKRAGPRLDHDKITDKAAEDCRNNCKGGSLPGRLRRRWQGWQPAHSANRVEDFKTWQSSGRYPTNCLLPGNLKMRWASAHAAYLGQEAAVVHGCRRFSVMQAAPCVSRNSAVTTTLLDHIVKRYTARRACCRLLQYVITVL